MAGMIARLTVLCCLALPVVAIAATIPEGYVLRDSPEYQAAITGEGETPVFHHLPYKIVLTNADLDRNAMKWDHSSGESKVCRMVPQAKKAVIAVLDAVNAKPLADGRRLFAASCYRSIERQKTVFCAEMKTDPRYCRDPAVRAVTSAPSGYSEHATGYTLDFTTCTVRANLTPLSCADLTEDFAKTSAFALLVETAKANGFEMSFPLGDGSKLGKDSDGQTVHLTNQGVAYEPWHWRWVGPNDNFTGAAQAARKIFARARTCFKTNPGIAPISNDPETDQPISCPSPIGS